MPYAIYTLSDPRDNSVRYVGMSKNAYRRYISHLFQSGQTNKDKWVQELLYTHLVAPILRIIETNIPSFDEARNREAYWIQKYRDEGASLTNQANTYYYSQIRLSELSQKLVEPLSPRPIDNSHWALDIHARDIASSLGGRLIGRWQDDQHYYKAFVFSRIPGRRHKMISMEMNLVEFVQLPEDEIRRRIKAAIVLSEGRFDSEA